MQYIIQTVLKGYDIRQIPLHMYQFTVFGLAECKLQGNKGAMELL